MGRKRGKNAWIAAVLIVVSLVNGVPASAASETETEYIVKYKESAAWLMEDDSVPFDVVTEAEMNRLRSAGLLEWYEPDGVMTLLDETASPWYEDDKWDLALIQADAAFEQNYTGRGLRIGILDSGINPHADLTGNLLPGHNYLEDADADNTIDAYGHGTLVAGLISGAGENGAIGVATGAEIVPLKVTDASIRNGEVRPCYSSAYSLSSTLHSLWASATSSCAGSCRRVGVGRTSRRGTVCLTLSSALLSLPSS